jgi:hypothetical protein
MWLATAWLGESPLLAFALCSVVGVISYLVYIVCATPTLFLKFIFRLI